MRLFLLFLAVMSLDSQAQVPDSRYLPNIKETFENHCSVCDRPYSQEICKAAEAFDIEAKDLLYVLNRQKYFYDHDITEGVQNLLAAVTPYYSRSKYTIQELLNGYRDEQNGHIEYINSTGTMPDFKSKNSFNSRIYASLGPSQLQIIRAIDLYEAVSPYMDVEFSLKSISKSLLNTKNSIYYLAAELAEHQRLYSEIAGVDIRGNSIVHWQLHNMGRAKERAYYRRVKGDRGHLEQTPVRLARKLDAWVGEICR